MKQMVILSGKGGTGKTSLTAAFAHLAAESDSPSANGSGQKTPLRLVLADADVDASNLELVLKPTVLERHDFWGGQIAVINPDECDECGICREVCRFEAIENPPLVDTVACEGCAACMYQCPHQAIYMEAQLAGQWFRSLTPYGPLFHAALRPAQENSGKLVALVKQQARQLALDRGYDLVMIDGPPGIGCPVISAVTGVDLALIVAEPTAAGVHDLERVLQTTGHFRVPAVVCINKTDLHAPGTASIETFCREHNIEVVGHIPFDVAVTRAMVQGAPVTIYANSPVGEALREVWKRVLSRLILAETA